MRICESRGAGERGAFLLGGFAGAAEFANVGFLGSADLSLSGKSIVRRGAHIITVAMKTTTAVKPAMFVSAAALFCLCGCADSHLHGPAPESAPKSVLADAPKGAGEIRKVEIFSVRGGLARGIAANSRICRRALPISRLSCRGRKIRRRFCF